MKTTNNEDDEIDVCEELIARVEKKINTAEVVYSLCYEDVLAVIAEVHGEEALEWDEDELLSVIENAKGWLEDSVDWFFPTCSAIEGQLEDDEEEE